MAAETAPPAPAPPTPPSAVTEPAPPEVTYFPPCAGLHPAKTMFFRDADDLAAHTTGCQAPWPKEGRVVAIVPPPPPGRPPTFRYGAQGATLVPTPRGGRALSVDWISISAVEDPSRGAGEGGALYFVVPRDVTRLANPVPPAVVVGF